jgi:tRNA-modifying protein YgfZ
MHDSPRRLGEVKLQAERIGEPAMTDTSVALLPDRGIVEVEGEDAPDFLQSLVTNDMDRAEPGEALFAGLLTPQGKIVFDFLIFCAAPNRFLLDCPAEIAADLAKRLSLYRLRAKVSVTDRSAEIALAVALQDGAQPAEGMLAAFADPRYAQMPRRFIIAAPQASADAAHGLAAYHAARIAHCVPEGYRDYRYGEVFPHEVCYDLLGGVDFEKGCYVGQEVVSRMHHRGIAKTRICGVRGAADLPATGTEISGGEYPVGHLGSSCGPDGIALIRLDRADETLGHGVPLHAGDVRLTLVRPQWANYEIPSAGSAA